MKSFKSHRVRGASVFAVLAFTFGLVASGAQAQTTPVDPSVVALDNLFKTLKPNQEIVYVDDMGFKVSALKQWRNYLAGGRGTSATFGGAETTRWPNRRVPFIFDGNMTQKYRDDVTQGIFAWQKVANISWVPALTNDANYVRFFYNGSSGMNSFVGQQGGGQQIVNIDASSSIWRCAHEIGHAMGMHHEQCRPDRDTFVTVTSTSGANNALTTVNWAKLPTSRAKTHGTYDFDSLMHYPASSSALSDGKTYSATITPKEPYYSNAGKPRLGQESHISTLDAAAMVAEYGPPCSITGRVTTSSGVGIQGLTLTCSPTGNSSYFGSPVTTDAKGFYTLPGTATGKYSVTLSGTPIIPVSKAVTIATTSATGQNFSISDGTKPTTTISAPQANTPLAYATTASGTADDNLGVDYVGVLLRNNADGKWWVWDGPSKGWGSTTFDTAQHFKIVDNASNSAHFDWSTSLPGLGTGSYNLQAKAVDIDGNGAASYTSIDFSIDATGPAVVIVSPGHTKSVSSLSSISGTATDENGIQANVVNLTLNHNSQYWNGTSWQTQIAWLVGNVSNGAWSTSLVPKGSNLTPGFYTLSAKATDNLGRDSTYQSGVNQTSFTVDVTPPTATVDTPANGSSVSSVPSISGTASDDTGIHHLDLDIRRQSDGKFWDNDHWGNGSATLPVTYDAASKTWANSGPLPRYGNSDPNVCWTSGSYDISIIAHDNAGNSFRADSVITFSNTFVWTGETLRDNDPNNNSDNWGTSDNWSPTGVPGAGDIAVILNGDTVQSGGSRTVDGLALVASTLNTASLSVKNLTVYEGTLNGGAINSNGGEWNWTGAAVAGTWSVASGSTLNISGSRTTTIADLSTLSNAGTVNWSGSGSLYSSGYYGATTINNQSGGVWNFMADGTPFSTTYGSTFNNAQNATINKYDGSGTITLSGWTWNNAGQLRSESGKLAFNTTLNLNDGGTVAGSGQHEFVGGTLNVNGTTTANSTFTVSGGTINGVNATSKLAGGTWGWTGGALQGTLLNSGTLNISGTATKTVADNSKFNNSGTINWSGGDIYSSGYYGAANLNNQSGGTWNSSANAKFSTTYGAIFNNKAESTFACSGTGTSTFDWAFNNDGTAKCTSSNLTLNAGGTDSGSFESANGTLIRFTGGTHTLNSPTFSGAGLFQLSGATLTQNGTLTLGNAASPSVFEIASGTLNGTGTTTSGNANPATLNWKGGTIAGTQTWSSSLQTNISDPSTGATTKTVGDNATINNDGKVSWSGTGLVDSSGYYGAATFNNRSGATFTFANAGTPFKTTYGSTFNNQSNAKLIKNGSGTTTLNSWGYSNASEIQAASGVLEFTSTLALRAGTKFSGAGTTRLAGAVNADAPFSTSGPVLLDGGTFTGAAGTTYTGTTWKWTSGAIEGRLAIQSGSLLTLSGTADKVVVDNTIISNNGNIKWTGGKIYSSGYYGAATINNQNGGVFDLATDGTLLSTTYGANFNNLKGARLVKSAGTGTTTLSSWTMNNGVGDGLNGNAGGDLTVNTGTLDFNTNLTLHGGVFTGAGTTLWSGGTVAVKQPIFVNSTTLLMSGARVVGSSAASVKTTGASNVGWTSGAIEGQLTVQPGSVLTISGTAEKGVVDNAVINNSGTINWTGGKIYCAGYYGPGIVNNLSGGVFNARTSEAFTTTYGSTWNNSGTINIGTNTSYGAFNCNWNFVQSASGILNSKVGGVAATKFDVWKLNGGANLNGVLNAIFTPAYVPPVGAQFPVVIHGARTGQFARVQVAGVAGVAVATRYNAADVTLEVTRSSLPVLSVNDVKVTEGNTGMVNANFSVSLSAASTVPVTVKYATSNVTALAGSDYTATSGTLTFAPNEKTKIVTVPVSGDLIDEDTETFNFTLSAPTVASISDALGVGTITDDDTSVLSVDTPTAVVEGNSGTVAMKFNIKLSTPSSKAIAFKYQTPDASSPATPNAATSGVDFVPVPSTTFTFAPGQTSKLVSVLIKGDTAHEINENVALFVSPVVAGVGAKAVGVITNDDAMPSFSINNVSALEGNGGTKTLAFTIKLSAASGLPASVKLATANGTATVGSDYLSATDTLLFAPGETSKTINVTVRGDTLVEPDETFKLVLSGATGGVLAGGTISGTATITNDDKAADGNPSGGMG